MLIILAVALLLQPLTPEIANPGTILVSGILLADSFDVENGYFTVGTEKTVTIVVVPQSVPWFQLKARRGQQVELVLRPARELQQLKR